jgi:hypothetical protein
MGWPAALTAKGLARAVALATGAMTVAAAALPVAFPIPDPDPLGNVVGLLFVASFSGMGYVLASRRPDNPIGWIFAAMGLGITVVTFSSNYAIHGLRVDPGALPGAELMAWVGNWYWALGLSPIAFVLLLFPDGRYLSPRWGLMGRAIAVAMPTWFVAWAFMPGPMTNSGFPSVDNPLGIDAAEPVLVPLGAASGAVLIAGIIVAGVSVIIRFRRSTGVQRRQMKWLAYAGGLVLGGAAVEITLEAVVGGDSRLVEYLQLALVSSLASVPIAVGVAILRYRLYDIDRLISRTLVYALLSLLLVAVYAGGVFGGSALVRALTGDTSNALAVAATTLVIAALFRPARARIQEAIDRRFYRTRYDAQRALDGFSARLRDSVELGALRADVLRVVDDTVRPAHASLWLRP